MTPEQQKKFKYWQWRTLIGTMIGYIFFYLIRKISSSAMLSSMVALPRNLPM